MVDSDEDWDLASNYSDRGYGKEYLNNDVKKCRDILIDDIRKEDPNATKDWDGNIIVKMINRRFGNL